MQHSVKQIAKNYHKLSELRYDTIRFEYLDFIQYAKDHMKEYSLIQSGDDLLVSTWYSNDLIDDYIQLNNIR